MKKLILAIMFLLTSTMAFADFIVCDVPPAEQEITRYILSDNGVELANDIVPDVDGNYGFIYDVGVIDSGIHRYTAIACNVRGCSEASDPFVLPSTAGVPSSLTWIKQP